MVFAAVGLWLCALSLSLSGKAAQPDSCSSWQEKEGAWWEKGGDTYNYSVIRLPKLLKM